MLTTRRFFASQRKASCASIKYDKQSRNYDFPTSTSSSLRDLSKSALQCQLSLSINDLHSRKCHDMSYCLTFKWFLMAIQHFRSAALPWWQLEESLWRKLETWSMSSKMETTQASSQQQSLLSALWFSLSHSSAAAERFASRVSNKDFRLSAVSSVAAVSLQNVSWISTRCAFSLWSSCKFSSPSSSSFTTKIFRMLLSRAGTDCGPDVKSHNLTTKPLTKFNEPSSAVEAQLS